MALALDPTLPHHPVLDAARALGPAVSAVADDIEHYRRLPQGLVDDLTAAEIFQLYLPASIGGPEVHPLVGFAVCEELARHDGSVAWCAQVAAAVTVFLAWLDPAALEVMVAETDGPLHVAGSARPLGRAEGVEGGYRVTGQWNFASGVRHANWFLGTSFVTDESGRTAPRSMLIPVSDGRIEDNWDVFGMRGTGSDDFVLDDVFVPAERVCSRRWVLDRAERLYDPRLMMVGAWAPTAGIGTGLAQGAIDTLCALGDLASTGSPVPLRERPPVQDAVAMAETRTGAARAYVTQSLAAAWDALDDALPEGVDPAHDRHVAETVARAQLAITHSLNEAVAVADLCFHAAGTNAISTAHRFERILRDAHTAVQHAAGQPVHRRAAGRVLLGLDAGPTNREGPGTPKPA